MNLLQLEKSMSRLVTLRDEYDSQKNNLESEISSLDEKSYLLDKVSELFKHLLDVLLEDKKKEIEDLVTYGLKSVFTDQDLKFHIDIEPKYNTIYTTFSTEQVGITQGDVTENFGGGVVNIESFLLRIITLFQTGLSPFLFLDECFSNLSEEYLEECSSLLKNLCDKMGLTLFLITHKDLILSKADNVYRASSKNDKLVLVGEK